MRRVPSALALASALAGALAAAGPAAADCRFTVNFAFGSSEVPLADRQLVTQLARAYPAGPFRLSGHADDEGSTEANFRIGADRARAVMALLAGGGAQPGAVTEAWTAGDVWPAVPTRAPNPLNRRVELLTPECDRTAFPQARIVRSPGIEIVEGTVALLPPPTPLLSR